ncbi:MAG: chitobiase/beta-hexosaminidase C-terminal domain-containing protein [Bacteroidales bacterium]|jgi:hypothetical protein|nr:chitobiase/beta-hexosaminidase C-terminal domain-containing protein [Bacteroidales bacterium]
MRKTRTNFLSSFRLDIKTKFAVRLGCLLVGFIFLLNGFAFGQRTFQKITSVEEITSGNYIIVADGYNKSMGGKRTSAGTFFDTVDVHIGGDKITISGSEASDATYPQKNNIFYITKSGSQYTIGRNGQYVGMKNTSTQTDWGASAETDAFKWTIDYTSSAFRICNVGTTARFLKYNSKSAEERFSTYTASQANSSFIQLFKEVIVPPTVEPTTGGNTRSWEMVEGNSWSQTINLTAENITEDLSFEIVPSSATAATTVSPTSMTIGEIETTNPFDVTIGKNGTPTVGVYQDTLVIRQGATRVGEVVINFEVLSASVPTLTTTYPTESSTVVADSVVTTYALTNLSVNGTVRARLSGGAASDSVNINSGDGTATITLRNIASGNYTLEANLVETANKSNVLATALSVDFTIDLPDVAEVTYSPFYKADTNKFEDSVDITLASVTDGASIYYTTDGSDPKANGTLYSAPVRIYANATIKAFALKAHCDTSPANYAKYTRTDIVENPVFEPYVGGGYKFIDNVNVSITSATESAEIRYTDNGDTPNEGSTLYSTPINLTATTTLKAIAYKAGDITSGMSSLTYTSATPTAVSVPYYLPGAKVVADLTEANGYVNNLGTGADYAAGDSARIRFDNTGEELILAYNAIADALSFRAKTNTGGSPARFAGTMTIATSLNGYDFTTLFTITKDTTTSRVYDYELALPVEARYVRFRYDNKIAGNFALGKIRLSVAPCSDPALNTAELTSTTAKLSWIGGAISQSYELRVAESSYGLSTAAVWTVSKSDTVIENLVAEKKYYYSVTGLCSGGRESVAVVDSFTTLSAAAPVITVNPEALAFDTIVTRTQTKNVVVTTENLGEAATVTLKDGTSGFAVLPSTADDNDETTVAVTYTATGTATQIDTVIISGGGITKEVALAGTPRTPSVTTNPSTIVRFSTNAGTPQTKNIVITGSYLLGDVSLALQDGSNYTLDKSAVTESNALRAGGDTVTVTFTANAAAALDTVIVTSSNATTRKIALSGTSYTSQDLLLVEDFDYAISSIDTSSAVVAATGWIAHSVTNNRGVSIVNPGLSLDGYAQSGIGGAAYMDATGNDIHKLLLQPVDDGSAYVAFMFRTKTSNSKGYFMHLNENADASGNWGSRLFVDAAGTGIGINETSSDPATWVTVVPDNTYFGVIEYDLASGTSSLYVMDEFSTTKPSVSATSTRNSSESAVVKSVNSISLRQYNANQKVEVDGIRVARTWAEAVKATSPAAFTVRPAYNNVTATSANVSFTLDKDAKTYYVVKTASQAGITAESIVSDITKDSINAISGVAATISLTGLVAETPYYVYLTAKNIGGYSVVDSVLFTTISAVAPVITVDPSSLAFDTVITRSQSKNIAVTTANLGGDASVTLKDGTVGFAVNTGVAADNDVTVVTVTYTAGVAEAKDTVVVTGGGVTKLVALSGMPVYPSVLVNVESLQFDAVVATPASKKIVVSGTNLLGDITLAKTHASYTLSKTTVLAADAMRTGGDTVTVTYLADVVATDTVVLTSSYATTVKVSLSGTVRDRYANMVANPGFEIWDGTAPDSWTATDFVKKTDDVHGGLNAAYVNATARKDLITYINGVEAGKHYTISFWYKIDTLAGSGLRIWSAFRTGTTNITIAGDSNLAILQPSTYQTTVGEWTKFEISDYVAPELADNFRFEVRTMTGSKARFDDFFFGEVDLSAPQIFLSTSSLAYTNVALGTQEEQQVTVSTANITDSLVLSITGPGAAYFSAPAKVGYGNDTFNVVYTPLAEGSHTATLTVSNGSLEKYIALSGNSIDMSIMTPISSIVTGAAPSPYNGQTVNITGIVVAKTTANNFYVQEAAGATHGLYIYRNGAGVAVGDSVVVTGGISEYHGLTELTTASAEDITVISSGKDIFAPVAITDLSQLNKTLHGVLVTITDTLYYGSAGTSNKYVVNNGTEDITVLPDIYNSVSLMGEGKIIVSITGMASYYDANQIVPLSEDDITVVALPVGVEVVKTADVKVYPNPSDGVVTVEAEGKYSVAVYSVAGALVNRTAAKTGSTVLRIPTQGIYFLKVMGENGAVSMHKVIVK